MNRKKLLLIVGLCLPLATWGVIAQIGGPALPDGPSHEEIVEGLNNGDFTLDEIRFRGLQVFATPFNTFDGQGDGPFDLAEYGDPPDTRGFGGRPTLQGNGLFLRVNGLDAQSCNECHTIVSNRTFPPVLGIAGVGGAVQNAIIMPTLFDVADSQDDRVANPPGVPFPFLPLLFDGIADFNGRFANPPFLFGGGGVELLGKEMTVDLQELLDQCRTDGGSVDLDTHGVNFGYITCDEYGHVDLSNVEGLGFVNNEEHEPEEVLIVRPFGRKGENFSMRDFDRGAMQFHFGMQPVEVVGANVDSDGDGVKNEVTVGEMTALHIFDVTNPRPFAEERNAREQQGFERFQSLGCSYCHRPVLETESRFLPLAHPEVPHDPFANVYAFIDLVEVGFEPAPGGGVFVPFFADLKRHFMGEGLAETFEGAEIPNGDFTTARLWGIADTAPYIHDARATTLFEAIEAHGGEAQSARDAFLMLGKGNQRRVIEFLLTLRVPENPNEELLP